ncbi:MAG TPA: hypothetical protein GX708_15205 [Gallicola sp.]|nr:hypothetical protein [Gallicola sp.]
MYKGILTSKSIQRQFILSTKRRKKIDINSYWLLTKKEMKELNAFNNNYGLHDVSNNLVNDSNNEVNVNNNEVVDSINDDTVNNKHTKESKVKKSNDKKINDKGTFQVPSANFLTNSLIKNKYIESDSLEILKYNKLFDEAVDAFNFDDVLSVVDYLMKYSKKEGVVIENKYAFFEESLYKILEMLDRRANRNESKEDIFKQFFL